MALPCLAPNWTRWLALNMFEPSSDPPIKKAFQLLPRGQEPQVGRQGDPVRIVGGQRPTRSTRGASPRPDAPTAGGLKAAVAPVSRPGGWMEDGGERGRGSSAQCGCGCGLPSRFPNLPVLGSMFTVLAPSGPAAMRPWPGFSPCP